MSLEAQGDEAVVMRFLAEIATAMSRNIESSEQTPRPEIDGEVGFSIRR